MPRVRDREAFERRRAEMYQRMHFPAAAAAASAARKRKAQDFARSIARMANTLKRQERELRLERYVTAFYGCNTSWPRILESAKYVCCASSPHPEAL